MELEPILAAAEARAKDLNVDFVPGDLFANKTTFEVNTSQYSAAEFVELAHKNGSRFLMVKFERLSEDDLADEKKQEFERFIGKLHHIHFYFLSDQLLMSWNLGTEWEDPALYDDEDFKTHEDVRKKRLEEEHAEEDRRRQKQEEEREYVEKIARILAYTEEFKLASNWKFRHRVGQKWLKEHPEFPPLEDDFFSERVVREAGHIFDWEIKPKLEEEISDKVLELRNQGKSYGAIATALRISPNKVRSILS